ncbi:MAG: GNAT family N-acetyltransferase [Thermaurantiacus tibetensis]|uniref:GNAT family N-acetyltransferase n=1 Tax=Thermaurantiacus tibetensis TaxID=2759035 RepID=UPI00188DF81A|nr:GNAT family N-acetyltransferase [Thermaurantiacus tibetensis]
MADGGAAGRVRILHRAADLPAADWDRLAGPDNPFVCHAFVSALEDSGSAVARAGWQAAHLLAEDAEGRPAGLMPAFAKGHSQGEYVFDHGWAEAWHRAGGRYYPKLQIATPFTPATAPKILATDPAVRAQLVRAAEAVVAHEGWSSAHATFLPAEDVQTFAAAGWLERHDIQFHFDARGLGGFADFLGQLSSRKRKELRREREAALAAVDRVEWLTGSDLTEAVWDDFFRFYMDTGGRKWGRPYLTRAFFSLLSERMADRVLLVVAVRGGRRVAGALNFLGSDCLYGRHWGCIEDIPFLHFELCYHQAIDIAGHLGLARVEAGAQGPHKVKRGYRPVITRSMHHLADLRLAAAVADFLERERAAVAREAALFEAELPFRHGPAPGEATPPGSAAGG